MGNKVKEGDRSTITFCSGPSWFESKHQVVGPSTSGLRGFYLLNRTDLAGMPVRMGGMASFSGALRVSEHQAGVSNQGFL